METSPLSYVIFMTESARWDLFLCSAGCPTLEKRGHSFVVVPMDVAVERCRSDGPRDKAVEAAQASGITVKGATCSLRPETYEPEADWHWWCSKKLYLPLLRWMIVSCSDMVSDIVMWFEGFKVQL